MQQFLQFTTWRLFSAQHVSGVLTPIIRIFKLLSAREAFVERRRHENIQTFIVYNFLFWNYLRFKVLTCSVWNKLRVILSSYRCISMALTFTDRFFRSVLTYPRKDFISHTHETVTLTSSNFHWARMNPGSLPSFVSVEASFLSTNIAWYEGVQQYMESLPHSELSHVFSDKYRG
jgi:hypothetical protein